MKKDNVIYVLPLSDEAMLKARKHIRNNPQWLEKWEKFNDIVYLLPEFQDLYQDLKTEMMCLDYDLYKSIRELIGRRTELGYEDPAEFVRDAIRRFLEAASENHISAAAP